MSISTGATDVVGGGGYGFGGFGGIAPIGLIGLNTFLGNGMWKNNGFRDGIAGTTVLEQNVSELRKDVQGVNTTVEALANERRGRDNREIEINVTQTNQQTQNQLQAQLQQQNQFSASMFNSLGDQVNRATNSVVNLGGTILGNQDATQSNTKVKS